MDDLLADFLTETNENLAELDLALVTLERTPDDAATLALIFRMVHTIKGTCGFLGLPRLERVAHAGESVLGKVRDGAITVTPEMVSLVLTGIGSRQGDPRRPGSHRRRTRRGRRAADRRPGSHRRRQARAGSRRTAAAPPAAPEPSPQPPPAQISTVRPRRSPLRRNPPRNAAEDGRRRHAAAAVRGLRPARSRSRLPGPSAGRSRTRLPPPTPRATDQTIRVDRRSARGPDDPGQRAGADPQPASPARPQRGGQRLHRAAATAVAHHLRPAGGRDEDAHAADRQCLEQPAAAGARPGAATWTRRSNWSCSVPIPSWTARCWS